VPGFGKLVRQLRYGKPIVVVSGLPRSGTSMAMKMLEAGGMDMVIDHVRTADEDNPKGYYEDQRVMDLAQAKDKSWLKDSRGKCVKIIAYLLSHLPMENNYKVVFMHRDIEEVLASQKKMLDRRGEASDTEDAAMIEAYDQNLERVRFMLKFRDCFETLEINYREVIREPEAHANRIADFLGLPLDRRAMASVVDPELYRNRGGVD
jgi:hypothetical protein